MWLWMKFCDDRIARTRGRRPSAMQTLLVTLLPTIASTTMTALIGDSPDLPDGVAAIKAAIKTEWKLVRAANATAEQIAEATVFVETSMDILAKAKAGKLFQFAFTGVPDSYLATIPPRFTVSNCHQSSVPIAEYVLAATLSWTVQLNEMQKRLRSCTWKSAPPGNNCTAEHAHFVHKQFSNMTMGILGYGHIGEAIADRAAAFGTRLIATTIDPPKVPPKPLSWIGDDSMNAKLFEESDFVVICVPLTNSTRGLVDAKLLSHLSTSGVLVNIARGAVVDEEALYNALAKKTIGGAVIDVWWHDIFRMKDGDYGPASWPSSYRFDELDNVVMSAHTSGITKGSEAESVKEIAKNLDNLALGKPLENVIRPGKPAQ